MRFKKAYLVAPEHAASLAMAHVHIGVASRLPGLAGWRGVHLDAPATIHDLNEQPLFYDFPVIAANGGEIGVVRAAAATPLADPVVSTYLGPAPWSVSRATDRATEVVTHEYGGQVLRTLLVCYAYPKLGIAVGWKKARGRTRRTIFDIGDLSVVPEAVERDMRGSGPYSFYAHLPEEAVARGIQRYGLHEKLAAEFEKQSGRKLGPKMERRDFDVVQVAVIAQLKRWNNRLLTFCSHSYSHECFVMHGQETYWWCVVATGQMMLDFWRYNFTQTQIAAAMNTVSGTDWSDEEDGFESLTADQFDSRSDFSPTFLKVREEIDANRPFDYSYSYHSMACAGYSERNINLIGRAPVKQVYLYDPWPVGVGTIRWEAWSTGALMLAGFVYLRRVRH